MNAKCQQNRLWRQILSILFAVMILAGCSRGGAAVPSSEEPVFGPPLCLRDTDGDFEPDAPTTTFSTKDDWAFIGFTYDNMQDGMDFWYKVILKGDLDIALENHPRWDGGEEGTHFTYAKLQHTPGSIAVELYLGEKLMQTIECEIVEP